MMGRRIPARGWCFEATRGAADRLCSRRGEGRRGGGGREQGTAMVPSWLAGEARGGGGWRLCVWRREKWGSRGERESSVSERERGGGVLVLGLRPESLPPLLFPFSSLFFWLNNIIQLIPGPVLVSG